jgi:ribonuclease HII
MKRLSPSSLSSLTVQEIASFLDDADIDVALLVALRADPRAGVQALADRIERRIERTSRENSHEESMAATERALRLDGLQVIAGVDEAGRGPLAGPVVAAAVVLPDDCGIRGIDDSKKLTPDKREALYERITGQALAWGVGIVEHDEIDETGIGEASLAAMRLAIRDMGVRPDIVLVDGNRSPGLGCRESLIVNGDGLCRVIAAASIVAKVTRDRIMAALDRAYPGYNFARHKGYGVDEHIAALKRLGPCDIHRFSFYVVSEVSPPGAAAAVLERRLAHAPTRSSFDRAAAGIARVREHLRGNEVEHLRAVYQRLLRRFEQGRP